MRREDIQARYRAPRSRSHLVLALAVALSVGGGLLVAMRSMFRVGEDMVRSVDESRLPQQPVRRGGQRIRALSDEEALARRAAVAAAEAEAAPRAPHVVRGTVKLPANVPADEEVFVVLVHTEDAKPVYDRVRLAVDGSFTLRAPVDVERARVAFDAHYLYAEPCTHVRFTEPLLELVINAQLGGRIRGRVELPASRVTLTPLLRALPVHAYAVEYKPRHVFVADVVSDVTRECGERTFEERDRQLDAALSVEIGGVAPGRPFVVDVDGALHFVDERGLAPGETRAIELELQPLNGLAGAVVDENGAPVRGAACEFTDRRPSSGYFMPEKVLTDETGRFGCVAKEVRSTRLRVSCAGFHETERDVVLPEAGRDVSDVVVTLRRDRGGTSLRGRVVWADGAPAANALVVARLADVESVGARSAVADEDGAFELTACERGHLRILARAREYAAASDDIGDERLVRSGMAAIDYSTENAVLPLVIQLGPTATLRGVVVDERGAPCPHFTLHAAPEHLSIESFDVSSRFNDEAGRFELTDLARCRWGVDVADGAYRAPHARVDLSNGVAFVRVVLSHVPIVTGTVADAETPAQQQVRIVAGHHGRHAGNDLDPPTSGVVREDRSFEIAWLANDDHHVHAVGGGLSATRGEVVRVTNDGQVSGVALGWERGAVRLVVDDPEFRAAGAIVFARWSCAFCDVELRSDELDVDADGSVRLEGLALGRVEFNAANAAYDKFGWARADVESGATTEAHLSVR